MENCLEYLRSDLAMARFASKGQLGEASKAIEPILQAFEDVDITALPKRISKGFQKQIETEIDQLKNARLKRVIRITSPRLRSSQNKNSMGFTRWFDASREWRECEIEAAVLDRYIDIVTGECVIEKFDENALLTLRQSRHIKASDQRKAKNTKKNVYIREHYDCPSCGAELEHIADSTNCPYCGAYITFNFFDWQLDSFYLDMHKTSLLSEIKETAVNAAANVAAGVVGGAAMAAELLTDAWEERSERTREPSALGQNSFLTYIFTTLLLIGILLFAALVMMPWYLRLALGVIAVAAILFGVYKYLANTDQRRKKKKIVRYSDAYLRSCIYDELWKSLDTDRLIDFSIDEVRLKSVKNTESTTTIEVMATVIKKYLLHEQKIDIVTEDFDMKLSRARYPDKKKNKGKIMEEKACPNCGANFEPDENHCCSYCGYGLKMENYIWRKVA